MLYTSCMQIEDATPVGRILTDVTVSPREPWSGVIPKDYYLRIVDLKGSQAVDFLCYDAADSTERYCAADTIKISGKIFLETMMKQFHKIIGLVRLHIIKQIGGDI